MKFNRIDFDVWNRTEVFNHYMNQNTSFSLTQEIDVSVLYRFIKQHKYRFTPALIFLITTVVNSHPAFRTSYNCEGELGYWDRLDPLYTIFDRRSESFSAVWTSVTNDFETFHTAYTADVEKYNGSGSLFPKTPVPENTFSFSVIPWTSFTSFNLNINNNSRYLLPIITAGRLIHKGNLIYLPISLQLHHAVCDGYHAGLFMNSVQELAHHPNSCIF
ncbi:type A chloramphenicol O-acetyltransferase [Paenibacillus silvae]|uniref:type A chloramphenicol O-acetyltransferase n=1 Tax=Paenibacillus silvae TaxID=1325358 RepID=UPI00166DAEF8|nr:type A chloramphenicol O-acetyltransferase [Paenibacillus silvae]